MQGITIAVPQIIKRTDYHEFGALQKDLQSLGADVLIEEVGFDGSLYVALLHTNDKEHQIMLAQLKAYYKQQDF